MLCAEGNAKPYTLTHSDMIYRISTAAIFSYDIVNNLSKQIGKTAAAASRGKKAMTPRL